MCGLLGWKSRLFGRLFGRPPATFRRLFLDFRPRPPDFESTSSPTPKSTPNSGLKSSENASLRGLGFVEKTAGVGSPPRPRIGDPRRENLHVARPWDSLDRRHTKLSGWRRSTRRLLGDRRLSVFATRPGVFCDLGRLKLTSECVFLLRAGHLPHHGDDQNAADRWVDPRVQVARPRHFALHRRTNGGAVAKARATSASRVCRPSVVTTCVAKHLRLRCWVAWAAPAAHVFATQVSSLQSQSLYHGTIVPWYGY